MRQLYPLLWIATVGLAAMALTRPGPLGNLLAAAATWEDAPWSNTNTPATPRTTTASSGVRGPVAPSGGSRPASWPGGGETAADTGTIRTYPVSDAPAYPEMDRQDDPEAEPGFTDTADVPLGPRQPGGPLPGRPPVSAVPAEAPTRSAAVPCEGAEILGRVGADVILAKELSFGIPELRARNKEVPPEILEAKIREVLKQRLDQRIEEKLVIQHAKRTIPAENFPKIQENVAREFESSQIPRLMKATGARSRQDLEDILHAAGSSLDIQKQTFVDQILAHEWLKQQVKADEEVSHEQMLDYYHGHIADFETPARARWEELMVQVTRFSSREDAYAALAKMGDQVLGGTPLAEVAASQSHGVTARQGGRWDWTSQGSLASEMLNRVIFGDGVRPGLPVGALSPILEDPKSLHIIRIVEREPPRRKPFPEAQVEIKKKIRADRQRQANLDYLAKLRRETPVWTAFDAPAAAQRSPTDRYLQ